jgi:hypothetical protein
MNSALINKKKYYIEKGIKIEDPILRWSTLRIIPDIGLHERLISLLQKLENVICLKHLIVLNPTHGGFICVNVCSYFDTVSVHYTDAEMCAEEVRENTKEYKNIKILAPEEIKKSCILFTLSNVNWSSIVIDYASVCIITPTNEFLKSNYTEIYKLTDTNISIYLPTRYKNTFYSKFKFYLSGDILKYDNLINLCFMVKNGGSQFEDILLSNLEFIDEWTILDTGSTDNTVDIINKILVGKKKGKLYQEPFVNFRDSRNRLLDLAGKKCKYIIMLDDTYILQGQVREFLSSVRGDQYADSFSVYIKSDDVEYGSNRILNASRNLRYKYKIHEIIDPVGNINVIIPIENMYILDKTSSQMNDRTLSRKMLDMKLLEEELVDDPAAGPRCYYYIAQTHKCLEQYEEAFNYFIQRINHPDSGFLQEKADAAFEAARVANFNLNKKWEICEKLYLTSHAIDPLRPEPLYFIGIHYYANNNLEKAFFYFKKSFEIGFPTHCQYSLKPTLSFYFLPAIIVQLCYIFKEYDIGEKAAELFINKNPPSDEKYNTVVSWHKIFSHINMLGRVVPRLEHIEEKPVFCFVANGGFNKWSGSTLLTGGMGGAETYIVEMARWIQKKGEYSVVVFCNCANEEIFEQVQYKSIDKYYEYIRSTKIKVCIISRYSEYYPATLLCNVENIYIVVHDLSVSGNVIPLDKKLKKIFCLTEWHCSYFKSIFPPTVADRIESISYGINPIFSYAPGRKIPYRFIYTSMPDRGLVELLKMWPDIHAKQPLASLHVYCDLNSGYVNTQCPLKIKEIRELLDLHRKLNIVYKQWVNKQTLADAWKEAEYWFYPCTFMETFCLSALEAARTKTLAISNGLAGLSKTISDRGITVEGNAETHEWKNAALAKLFAIFDDKQQYEFLVEKNYKWSLSLSWEKQADVLLSHQT